MKFVIFFLLFILTANCSAQPPVEHLKGIEDQTPKDASQTKQAVLIELFTSEGCSSCPAAERALAFLQNEQPYPQAELITLALHVDYWNRLGWKDEFSTPLFSQRQEFYVQAMKLDSAYTPQMVVDGIWQLTGSDAGSAAKAITAAAKLPKAKIELAENEGKLTLKISDAPAHNNATVYVAIGENNLATKVGRGENSGKTLEHQAVVRELRAVGVLGASQNFFEGQMILPINQKWKRENIKIVAFVQENTSRKILGAGTLALRPNQTPKLVLPSGLD